MLPARVHTVPRVTLAAKLYIYSGLTVYIPEGNPAVTLRSRTRSCKVLQVKAAKTDWRRPRQRDARLRHTARHTDFAALWSNPPLHIGFGIYAIYGKGSDAETF